MTERLNTVNDLSSARPTATSQGQPHIPSVETAQSVAVERVRNIFLRGVCHINERLLVTPLASQNGKGRRRDTEVGSLCGREMSAIFLANVAAAALSAGGPPVKRQTYDDLFSAPLQTPLHGKLALITGASSGIGRATACALANEGCNLILVARRSERLIELQDECKRRLPDVSVTCVAGDVCDDGLYDELRSLGCLENVDFFVNNAGGAFGKDRVVDADISDWKGMLDVNAMAAFRMVHAVLPAMVSRGEVLSYA